MSISTAVAHLGVVAGAVDDDVFGLHPQRQASAPSRIMALMSDAGMSMFATSRRTRTAWSAATRRRLRRRSALDAGRCATACKLRKDLLQQPALKEAIGLRRELKALLAALQALLLGHLPQQFFDLLLHLGELVHVARLGELRQARPGR